MIDIPDAPWVGLCKEDYYERFGCSFYEEDDDYEEDIWEDEDDEELYG